MISQDLLMGLACRAPPQQSLVKFFLSVTIDGRLQPKALLPVVNRKEKCRMHQTSYCILVRDVEERLNLNVDSFKTKYRRFPKVIFPPKNGDKRFPLIVCLPPSPHFLISKVSRE